MNDRGDGSEIKFAWHLVEPSLEGAITSKEKLKYALQCSGRNPSQTSIEKYWKKFGGSVSYSDFSKIMKRERIPSQAELMSIFKKLDRKGDGCITTSDLKRLLTKSGETMSEEETEILISDLDPGQDDKIDFTELCHLIVETTDDCVSALREMSTKGQRERKHFKVNKKKRGTRVEAKVKEEMSPPPNVIYKTNESDSNTNNNDDPDDNDDLFLSSSSPDVSSELPVISPTSLEDTPSPLPPPQENEEEDQKEATLGTPGEDKPVTPLEEVEEKEEEEVDEEVEEEVVPSVSQSESSTVTITTAATDDRRDGVQQTDHLDSIVTDNPLPIAPLSIQDWNIIQGKGCFYTSHGGGGDVYTTESHHYILSIPETTGVWIEMKSVAPGNPQLDVSLYVFHMTSDEEPDRYIAHTQHCISGNVWVCQLTLDPGSYMLLPYTTGCVLMNGKEGEEEGKEWVSLLEEKDDKLKLTQKCISVFTELFYRHDLDMSDSIAQNELEFFLDRANLEYTDDNDEYWKAIQENYEVNDDSELSLNGFILFNEESAAKRGLEGGAQYLRNIILAMGYNKQLKLTKACPFEFEVFTESCEGEIEILSQLSSAQHVERALASLAKSTGSATGRVDGADESQMITYTLVSPANIATTFIENKTDKNVTIKVDCSQSTNFICSFHSPVYIMTVPALSTKVAFHLVSKDPEAPFEVIFNASELK